jgi:hypothetical protein
MKVNLIPSKKLALLSAGFCAVMLAFSHNASALTLTFGDNNFLGQMIPGTGGIPERTAYVNHMIGMNPGGFGLFMNQTFNRSTNNFGALPTAVFARNGTGKNIALGTGLYSYLFARYSGVSFVWYVGNLSGNIQIPLVTATGGLLMGWTLFSAGGQGVPDGGTTVMLLGAALGALGMARRLLKI